MNTYFDIRYFSNKDLNEEIETLVSELEEKLSVTIESSEIFQINKNGQGRISDETKQLLEESLSYCEICQGKLDISVYPLSRAWGFTTGQYRVLSEEEAAELLKKVDYRKIRINDNEVILEEDMMLDLGSTAKGYCGDRIISFLKENGVSSALLDLGGNIQTLGKKPDRSSWNVGIRDPRSEGIIGCVKVFDLGVVSSGAYERYFMQGDQRYGHIIDPDTGYPVDNGLLSVTIITDKGIRADAFSTALYVMGEEEAIIFWKSRNDFEMILVNDQNEILISEGLWDLFSPEKDSTYELVRVER